MSLDYSPSEPTEGTGERHGQTDALNLAQGMAQKLETLDNDFRTHHHALVDLIDDEGALSEEQGMLDGHDDSVAELSARIRRLISACTPSSDHSSRKVSSRRLSHLQRPQPLSEQQLLLVMAQWMSVSYISMKRNSPTARKS